MPEISLLPEDWPSFSRTLFNAVILIDYVQGDVSGLQSRGHVVSLWANAVPRAFKRDEKPLSDSGTDMAVVYVCEHVCVDV